MSLKHVATISGVYVTMDTCKEKSMIVHLPNRDKIKFIEYVDGLYYFDTSKTKDKLNVYSDASNKGISLLSTIK